MAKKELTISEFREIIREEALKLKKRMVLENEKKALNAELSKLMSESYMEEASFEEGLGEMEEGIGSWMGQKLGLTDTPEAVQARKDKIMANFAKAKTNGFTKFQLDGAMVDEAAFIAGMEKNGFSGTLLPVAKAATLIYKPGAYGAARLGSGGASQGLGV